MSKKTEITKEQSTLILKYHKDGMNYTDIARETGLHYKFVARFIEKETNPIKTKLMLEEMTKGDRLVFITEKLKTSPRALHIFQTFNASEKQFFLDEYLNTIKSVESITEIEDQSLFLACIEYVLAYRSLRLNQVEQQMYTDTVEGRITDPSDVKYRNKLNSQFSQEYDTHMERYQSLIKSLKLNRDQRLDKIKSEKRTLIDVVLEFSNVSSQNTIIERIEELQKVSDEELKKMLTEGHLFGSFE